MQASSGVTCDTAKLQRWVVGALCSSPQGVKGPFILYRCTEVLIQMSRLVDIPDTHYYLSLDIAAIADSDSFLDCQRHPKKSSLFLLYTGEVVNI